MKLRNIAFTIHRCIGLAVGLLLVIVGLTGGLLVFEQDFDRFVITQQYGHITPGRVQLFISRVSSE